MTPAPEDHRRRVAEVAKRAPLHVEAGDGPAARVTGASSAPAGGDSVGRQLTGRGTLSRWVMSGEWPASSALGVTARNQASWDGVLPVPGRRRGYPVAERRRSATIPSARTSQRRLPRRGGSPPLSPAGRDTGLPGAAGNRRNRGGHRPAGPPLRLGDGAALGPVTIGRTGEHPRGVAGSNSFNAPARRASSAASTSRSMRCWSTSMTMRPHQPRGRWAAVDRLGATWPMQNPWVPPLNGRR